MKQLVIKKGSPVVVSVPSPQAVKGHVLVEIKASCVSPGTELAGMASSGKSMIQRVLEQPDKAKMALAQMKKEGIASVWKRAQAKFDRESAPGYTAAGVVLDVGDDVEGFTKGMHVAISGVGFASHAEVASVPVNLVIPMPEGVSFEDASTVALGAIAMQGVRRAEISLGDNVAVIGCGAIGMLAVQMLKASGCRVFVTDLDDDRLKMAKELGADLCVNARKEDVAQLATHWSDGHGVDVALVFAATQSSEPVSQGFRMCRRKGRVVLVGVAGGEYKRDEMYQKELDFMISTSYGPGRYDDDYELRGKDYPYGYVRWTEKRNMQSYLHLIADGAITVSPLINVHENLDDAHLAYEKLKSDEKPLLAVLKPSAEIESTQCASQESLDDSPVKFDWNSAREKISMGIMGAGAFVQAMHLPTLKAMSDHIHVRWICARTGLSARGSSMELEGCQITTDYQDLLKDDKNHVVLIGTRHNTHAELSLQALRAGKGLFIEKPMCLTPDEYEAICAAVEQSDAPFMVGYNRRFSPFVQRICKDVSDRVHPLMIQYTMNAGYLAPNHWTQGEEGGGRLMGEACHIIDVFRAVVGRPVKEISCHSIESSSEALSTGDNFSLTLSYEDGSVANLVYTALGHKSHPKETMKVFCDEKIWDMNDYQSMTIHGPKEEQLALKKQDKGHAEEMRVFQKAISQKQRFPIPWDQLKEVWETSYHADQICRKG